MERVNNIAWIDDDLIGTSLMPYIDELEESEFNVIRIYQLDDIVSTLNKITDLKLIIMDISMPIGEDISFQEAKGGTVTGLIVLERLKKDSNLKNIRKVIFTIVENEAVIKYSQDNNIPIIRKRVAKSSDFKTEIKKIINE